MRQHMTDYEVQSQVQQELSHGEKLLWSGRPSRGFRLQAADGLLIPFGVFWTGFTIDWEWTAIRYGAPFPFALFGIPFVLVGLYLVFGRFVVEARRRARTFYGLTDRRAIIVRSGSRRDVTAISLHQLSGVRLREGRNRRGTIVLGSANTPFGGIPDWFAGSGWPGMARYLPPSFEEIEDVRQVYGLLQESQHAEVGA